MVSQISTGIGMNTNLLIEEHMRYQPRNNLYG